MTDAIAFMFETSEIWAVSAGLLKDNNVMLDHHLFANTLRDYVAVLRSGIGIEPPFGWILGMEGLKGRELYAQTPPLGQWTRFGAPCVANEIVESGEYHEGQSFYGSLRPFFRRLTAQCNLNPDEFLKGYPD